MTDETKTLSGHGAPTKSTVGSIGDIYTDLDTGLKYECKSIYSYTGHNSLTVEYVWKKEFTINPDGSTEGIHLVDTLTKTEYMLLVNSSKLMIKEV